MKGNHSVGCPALIQSKCCAAESPCTCPYLCLFLRWWWNWSGVLYLACVKWNQKDIAVIGSFFASLCLYSVCSCGPRGVFTSYIFIYFCSSLIFIAFCFWVCMHLYYGGRDREGRISRFGAWEVPSSFYVKSFFFSSYFVGPWLFGFLQPFLDSGFSGGCMELGNADAYIEEIR